MNKVNFAKKTKEFRRTLPKTEKICKNCQKTFLGIYNRKYCNDCQTSSIYVKQHKKAKKLEKTVDVNNRVIHHVSCECKNVEFNCGCCGEPFTVRMLPRVYTYPKFCNKHRNPWKREIYLRNKK